MSLLHESTNNCGSLTINQQTILENNDNWIAVKETLLKNVEIKYF